MGLKARESTAASATHGSNPSSRLEAMKQRVLHSAITWQDATEGSLVACVTAVSSQGALISFSRTGDGGALHIYVKDGVTAENFYAANTDELERILSELTEAYK